MMSILLFLTAAVLTHPFHATSAEMQWNEQTRCVEVAWRLDMLDERWLKKQAERRSGADELNDDWPIGVLRRRIWFDPKPRKAVGNSVSSSAASGAYESKPLRWVGQKEEGAYVWWFFEVVCEEAVPPQGVLTTMLFDRDHSYQHRFVILNDELEEAKRAFDLTKREPRSAIVWEAE
ncbi:MAG: hypothetical protein AAF802_20640 [Planctomycetota bacterium]